MFFSFNVEVHKDNRSYKGTDYVEADNYEQAFEYLINRLHKAGWYIDFLKGREISVMKAEEQQQ